MRVDGEIRMRGKLYGVGVGPGDPALQTVCSFTVQEKQMSASHMLVFPLHLLHYIMLKDKKIV